MAPRSSGAPARRRILPAAALLATVARGSSAGNVTGRKPKQAPKPTLLGLRPDAGPMDGGTVVSLNAIGLNESSAFVARLRGVQPPTHTLKVKVTRTSSGLTFLTPNLTSITSAGAGILVSLDEDPEGVVKRRPRRNVAGPLFFRVLEPLKRLAPAWISPCCDFKLSGGQAVMLSGAITGVPAIRPVVRVRGKENKREVDGQLVQHEWGLAELGKDVPENAWHVYAVMPPWPEAEDDVVVEISWNNQQYSQLPRHVRFFLQKSLFGEAANSISEKHLAEGKKAEAPQEAVEAGKTQVSIEMKKDKKKKKKLAGETDYSDALLLDHHGDAFILARSKDLSHLAEDLRIVHDLFKLTITATVLGAVALFLRAPSIIGYLLGGVLLGPGCLDVVVELVQVESFAQLGVCLLLFCIGLELTWGEMRANLRASVAGLLAMALLCCTVVMFAKFCTKTPLYEALCVGLFSSLASTAVSLKAVPNASGESSPAETNGEASALLAILVTQDIVLAGMLAVMPLVFQHSADRHGATGVILRSTTPPPPRTPGAIQILALWVIGWGVQVLLMGLASLIVLCVMAYRFRRDVAAVVVPLRHRAQTHLLQMEGDFFTLLVLSYAFALSYTTDELGLSAELGAFLAGLSLTSFSSEVAKRTQHTTEGLKDTFVAWFFASIGLIVNPRFLLDNLRPILSVVALIFLLKLFTGFLPLWLLSRRGTPRPAFRALRTAWILANVSEFGFVLASKGASWGVISRHVYLLLVGANALSLFFAPWLFRSREWLLPEDRDVSAGVEDDAERPDDAAVGVSGKVASRDPPSASSSTAEGRQGRDAAHHPRSEAAVAAESPGLEPGPERYGRPCPHSTFT